MADIIPFDDNLPDDEFAPPMAGSPSCGERRVDALCERLNFADGQVVKGAAY